jgi:hypothetical protein
MNTQGSQLLPNLGLRHALVFHLEGGASDFCSEEVREHIVTPVKKPLGVRNSSACVRHQISCIVGPLGDCALENPRKERVFA